MELMSTLRSATHAIKLHPKPSAHGFEPRYNLRRQDNLFTTVSCYAKSLKDGCFLRHLLFCFLVVSPVSPLSHELGLKLVGQGLFSLFTTDV